MTEFNQVWKIFKTLDKLMGNYVMVDPNKKISIFQKIYHWMWLLGFISPLILLTSTIYIYMQNYNLSLVLQAATMIIMYLTAIMQNSFILIHKEKMMKVLNWCKKVQALDNIHMNRTRKFLAKVIRRLAVIFFTNGIIISIGMIIIGQLLPDEIYSKYRPPQPFILPVEDHENWTIYSITTIMQCFGMFFGQVLPCLYYSYFCVVCAIFFAHLNIILDDIENIHEMTVNWALMGYSNSKRFNRKMKNIVEKYCDGLE